MWAHVGPCGGQLCLCLRAKYAVLLACRPVYSRWIWSGLAWYMRRTGHVQSIGKLPYIHLSHIRSLWKKKMAKTEQGPWHRQSGNNQCVDDVQTNDDNELVRRLRTGPGSEKAIVRVR